MAFSYLGQPSDSEAHPDCSLDDILVNEVNRNGPCNIVPETSGDSDDGKRCPDLAPNTNSNLVVVSEKSGGLGLQDIDGQDNCLEMDWTEKEVCIKCDKGGKVLVCSDSSCPLAVHEDCMHCSARFDNMGNFYCPYCSYKRAMLETRKARKKAMLAKKALSGFLDKGMMDGDPLKQKAERVRRTEPNPLTFVRDIEHDGTKNMLDGNEVDNRFVQIEEDQLEERFNPECTTNISPSRGAAAPVRNEQNDVVLSRCGDNARLDGSGQHNTVIGQQIHPGPIIARGGSGIASCREEGMRDQFEIVQVGRSVQVEQPRLVDDHQNEGVVQDEQQAVPLNASPAEKETTLDGAIHISTKGELDNAEIVKENESRGPEEEEIAEQGQGTTEFSSGGDYMQQEHARASDVSPNWKRVKKKNQNVVQSPSVDNPRRSARKLSFELNANVVKEETKNAASKSRQRLTNPTFPNAKRKKLPWTAEEEEMLKEGVQKFSTMVNKNIPWRKILEFGHHVFDGTRTPVDLKDKWRNILVKECLQNN